MKQKLLSIISLVVVLSFVLIGRDIIVSKKQLTALSVHDTVMFYQTTPENLKKWYGNPDKIIKNRDDVYKIKISPMDYRPSERKIYDDYSGTIKRRKSLELNDSEERVYQYSSKDKPNYTINFIIRANVVTRIVFTPKKSGKSVDYLKTYKRALKQDPKRYEYIKNINARLWAKEYHLQPVTSLEIGKVYQIDRNNNFEEEMCFESDAKTVDYFKLVNEYDYVFLSEDSGDGQSHYKFYQGKYKKDQGGYHFLTSQTVLVDTFYDDSDVFNGHHELPPSINAYGGYFRIDYYLVEESNEELPDNKEVFLRRFS